MRPWLGVSSIEGAVVAVGRVEVVVVLPQPLDYAARILVVQTIEDVLDRTIAGVERPGDRPAALRLALGIDRGATVDIGFVFVDRSVVAPTGGDVDDADAEPFGGRDRHVAAIALTVDIDRDHAVAGRQDAGRYETPSAIDRNSFAVDPNRAAGARIGAGHGDQCHR